MVLQKQTITIPLARGIDTKSDNKVQDNAVEQFNTWQPYTGEVRKRPGSTALLRVRATGQNIACAKLAVESPQGNLLVAAHLIDATGKPVTYSPGVYSLDPTSNIKPSYVSPYYPVNLDYKFTSSESRGAKYVSHDIASLTYLGVEYICIAYAETNANGGKTFAGVVYTASGHIHTEYSSGTVSTGTVAVSDTQVHLYALSTTETTGVPMFLMVFEADLGEGPGLYKSSYSMATRTWSTAAITGCAITGHGIGSVDNCEWWDTTAVPVGGKDQVLIAYRSTGTGKLQFAYLNETGLVGSVMNPSGVPTIAAAYANVGINRVYNTVTGVYNILVCYHVSGSLGTVALGTLIGSTWTAMSGTFVLGSGLAITRIIGITVCYEDRLSSAALCTAKVYICYSQTLGYAGSHCSWIGVNMVAGTVTNGTMFYVGVHSKPWRNQESSSTSDLTQHLLMSSTYAVGMYSRALCEVSNGSGTLTYANMHSGDVQAQLFAGRTHIVESSLDSSVKYLCVPKLVSTFFSGTIYEMKHSAREMSIGKGVDAINSYLYAGSFVSISQSDILDNGFIHWPEILTYTNTASGSLEDLTYYMQAVYEYVDKNGERHLSAPSAQVSLAVSSGYYVHMHVLGLNLGLDDKLDNAVVRVYASDSATGVKTLQSCTSTAGIKSNPFVDFKVYTETGEALYTEGGVLDNFSAPCGNKMCISDNGRVFIVPSETPNSVYYSKKKTKGFAFEFASEYLKVDLRSADYPTGLASHGGVVYIFTLNSIYSLYGEGPDDTGSGPYLSPQKVASIGAVERSIMVVPQGIVFKSPHGEWSIVAGNQVQALPPVLYAHRESDVVCCSYDRVRNLWHYVMDSQGSGYGAESGWGDGGDDTYGEGHPSHPVVLSAAYVDTTHCTITFSKAVDVITGAVAANYMVVGPNSPTVSIAAPSGAVVTLTLATAMVDGDYVASASGVTDSDGRMMSPNPGTATFTCLVVHFGGLASLSVGLLAYYEMDSTPNDVLGLHDGIWSATPAYTTGKIGNAGNHTTGNKYLTIDVSTSTYFAPANISVSCWVKMFGNASEQGIVTRREHTDISWQIARTGTGEGSVLWSIGTAGGITSLAWTPTTLELTGWNHFVGTYNGTAMVIYINGVVEQSGNHAYPGAVKAGAIQTFIAYMIGYLQANAYTDLIGIWSKALTQAEVTWLYNSGSGRSY